MPRKLILDGNTVYELDVTMPEQYISILVPGRMYAPA